MNLNNQPQNIPLFPRNILDFSLFESRKGFFGYEGFCNLMIMFKTDLGEVAERYELKFAQDLFRYKKIKLKVLEAELKKYGSNWFEFANSDYVGLSTSQLLCISYFRIYQDFEKVSEVLNISVHQARELVNKAVRKMKYPGYKKKYCQWLLEATKQFSEREYLLSLPIYCLRKYLPENLVMILSLEGSNRRFGEIIDTISLQELRLFKGIGDKTLTVFENFLKRHKLIHYLKET